MNKFVPLTKTGILLTLGIALFPEMATACPGCGAALDSTIGNGFNTSVYFLMSMPFLVAGSLVAGVMWSKRNHSGR